MPGKNQAYFSRVHATTLLALPTPPETWLMRETELSKSEFLLLKRNGLLVRESGARNGRAHLWSVHPRWHQYAESYLESTDRFPCCNSRGVSNVDGNLECKDCGAPISRELCTEVLGK